MKDSTITYREYCRYSMGATRWGLKLSEYFMKKLLFWHGMEEVKSILEIGPGRGLLADWCGTNNIGYAAVEAAEDMAETLRKKGHYCLTAVVPPLPEQISIRRRSDGKENKYDLVILISVLEHSVNHLEALRLLNEFNGKPVLISVPQYEGYNFYRNVWDHSYICTRERLRGLLTAAGYKNIRITWCSGPFMGLMAWLWSRIGKIIPFELPRSILPENKLALRWHKISPLFTLRIFACGAERI